MLIALPGRRATLRVAAAEGEGAVGARRDELALGGSKAGRVLERGRSERVDSVLDDPEIDQQVARRLGVHSALYVPLLVRGQADRGRDRARQARADARASPTTTCASPSRSPRAPRSPSTSPSGSAATPSAASSRRRSSSARGSRASCTTRPGQALTSILLGLKPLEQAGGADEAAQAVASLRELVVSTLQNVRRLAVELRPSALDDFGLVPALERLAETFREQSGLDVDLESQLGDERLPPEVETTLYRIVQEALTNVVKHAARSRVSILLQRKRRRRSSAVVEDDGAGLRPGGTRDGRRSGWSACASASRSSAGGSGRVDAGRRARRCGRGAARR